MTVDPKESETYSEEETVARREAAIQRMLNTPHKPHKPTGLTPSKVKKPLGQLSKGGPKPALAVHQKPDQ